jgi:hypothetical protein
MVVGALLCVQGSSRWSSLNSLFLSNVSRQLKSITPPSIADSRLDRKTLSSSPNVGRRSLTLYGPNNKVKFLRSLRKSTMSSSGEQQREPPQQQQPWGGTGAEPSAAGVESQLSSSSNRTAGEGGDGERAHGEDAAEGAGGGGGGGRNKAGMQDPHNNGARAALTNEIRSEFFRLYGKFDAVYFCCAGDVCFCLILY